VLQTPGKPLAATFSKHSIILIQRIRLKASDSEIPEKKQQVGEAHI